MITLCSPEGRSERGRRRSRAEERIMSASTQEPRDRAADGSQRAGLEAPGENRARAARGLRRARALSHRIDVRPLGGAPPHPHQQGPRPHPRQRERHHPRRRAHRRLPDQQAEGRALSFPRTSLAGSKETSTASRIASSRRCASRRPRRGSSRKRSCPSGAAAPSRRDSRSCCRPTSPRTWTSTSSP